MKEYWVNVYEEESMIMVDSDIIYLYKKLKEYCEDMKSFPKHSIQYVKARHAYSIISYRLNVQYGKFGASNVPSHSKS